MSPGSSLFVRMCGLLSSVELGRTLFKWARLAHSAIKKNKSLLTFFVPALYSVRISTRKVNKLSHYGFWCVFVLSLLTVHNLQARRSYFFLVGHGISFAPWE